MLREEQQQIESWLDGTLPVEELALFEARMRDEPAFATEVALHRTMRQVIREKDIHTFRQTVDMLLDEPASANESPPRAKVYQIIRFAWAIAAALLLALAAVWFFQTPQPTAEQLYAEAFQSPAQFRYEGMPKDAERDTAVKNTLPDWTNLNKAWLEKKPDEALQLALEIAQKDTILARSQSAYYAAGIIALSEQKSDEALEHLEKAGSVKPYMEDILWYKALAQIQITLKDPTNVPQSVQALEKVIKSRQPENRHQWAEKMLLSLQKK